jgi:CBS domain-containing protein
VAAPAAAAHAKTDVLTYHYNAMRTGENLTETALTPANVTSATFGKLRILSADGLVDAAPLVVTQLTFAGVLHSNVVYIATEHDSVYAYDADTGGTPLAQVSLLGTVKKPATLEAAIRSMPEIGITATPVIDRSAGPNGTIFVVAMSKNTATGAYIQRLHALDLVTLQERPSSPVVIQATYPGSAGAFVPGQYKERGALLLQAGQIYTSWASHCDAGSYNSWIMAYNETTLAQTAVLDLTPNGSQGGIWDVAGLAVDSTGALYTLVGNGTFDSTLTSAGLPNQQDYGNAAVKLTQSGSTLAVSDYFATSNTVTQSQADTDLGSGSPLLIADQVDSGGATRQLMLAAGQGLPICTCSIAKHGQVQRQWQHDLPADHRRLGRWQLLGAGVFQRQHLPGRGGLAAEAIQVRLRRAARHGDIAVCR